MPSLLAGGAASAQGGAVADEAYQRTAICALLLRQRAQAALLFRRLFSSSSSASTVGIRGGDLTDELHSFLLDRISQLQVGPKLDRAVVWRLVCDMVRAPYSAEENAVRVTFDDAMEFLSATKNEAQQGGQTAPNSPVAVKASKAPPAAAGAAAGAAAAGKRANASLAPAVAFTVPLGGSAAHLQASPHLDFAIKKKLTDSKDVRGQRLRLLALSPTLRQRLRLARIARAHAEPDSPSLSLAECVELFASVDMLLSTSEARYAMQRCEETQGGLGAQGEFAAQLHNVVLFLSEFLVARC